MEFVFKKKLFQIARNVGIITIFAVKNNNKITQTPEMELVSA